MLDVSVNAELIAGPSRAYLQHEHGQRVFSLILPERDISRTRFSKRCVGALRWFLHTTFKAYVTCSTCGFGRQSLTTSGPESS